MTIGEKVKSLILEAGYKKVGLFYTKLASCYKEYAITPKTFYNLINNRTPPRIRTLNQIALVLGVKTSELRKGTDQEKRRDYGFFYYDEKATLYTYKIKASFLPLKLILKAGGKTTEEYDNADVNESYKWIYVVVGKISLAVRKEGRIEETPLHKGQTLLIDARNPHTFENRSKASSVVLIIHAPASNSSLNFI